MPILPNLNKALKAVAGLLKPVAMQVLLARGRLESGVTYHPPFDEVARDPYAVYRRLRDRDPIVQATRVRFGAN